MMPSHVCTLNPSIALCECSCVLPGTVLALGADGTHRALPTWRLVPLWLKKGNLPPEINNSHAKQPTLCHSGLPDAKSNIVCQEQWPGMGAGRLPRRRWGLNWTLEG